MASGAIKPTENWNCGEVLESTRFVFGPEREVISIRERLSGEMKYDSGDVLWESSLLLTNYIANNTHLFTSVLELGSGCGLPGIAIAKLSNANRIVLTDLGQATLDNILFNVNENLGEMEISEGYSRVSVCKLDWFDPLSAHLSPFEVVVGSDLIYSPEIVDALVQTIDLMTLPGGQYITVMPDSRRGRDDFIEKMKHKFDIEEEEPVPDHYKRNCLLDGSEDQFLIDFYRLDLDTYRLYRFKRHSLIEDELG